MDKQTHIINQARRLPIDARLVIIKAIQESIRSDEGRILAVDRIAQLIPIAEEIFDCTYDEKRKSDSDTLVRNVCAKVMREEGYSLNAIGRAMKRHSSSVYTMSQRADGMKDGYFGKDIQAKYYQFITRI